MPYAYFVDGEPGIQPVCSFAERLDLSIARANQAYDALQEAMLLCGAPEDLISALDAVERHIDRLLRERQELREKG